MSFISNLMGQRLIGTATICFYGKEEGSVEYKTKISDNEQKENDLLQLFALYYARILFNLNRGIHADTLIDSVQKTIESIFSKEVLHRDNILSSGNNLVESKTDGVTKRFAGELYQKSDKSRIVQTHMSSKNNSYYAPISVLIFLQYLINHLPEGTLIFLLFVLGGMHRYYQEVSDYSKMRSQLDAPQYGFNIAMEIMKNSE